MGRGYLLARGLCRSSDRGEGDRVVSCTKAIADLPGPLVLVQAATSKTLMEDADAYCLNWLLEEVSTSINTAAAGGNASLMAIG